MKAKFFLHVFADKVESCFPQILLPAAQLATFPAVPCQRGAQEKQSIFAPYLAPSALIHVGMIAYTAECLPRNLCAPPTVDSCHGEIEIFSIRAGRGRTHS